MIMCIVGQVSYMYHCMGGLDCKVVEMEMIMRERVEMILCVGALSDLFGGEDKSKSRSATYICEPFPPFKLRIFLF